MISDLRHPFFRPLWRRVVTVVLCLGWALMELLTGSPGWAMMFGAVGFYAGWGFFLAGTDWDAMDDERKKDD